MACGNQRTVGSPASLAGTSLHTGQPVTLTLKPAPADFGIKFRRVDIPDQPFISADVEKVQTVERATSLAEGSVKVHTVEHILSALTGMGIDNAVIEMDANEPPIGDGSSAPYVELIKRAGIVELDVPRRYLEVREQFVDDDNAIAKELLAKIQEIHNRGFLSSITVGDPGVGDTLENALGISRNPSKLPDYKGIELKASRTSTYNKTKTSNRVNLFTQVPDWANSRGMDRVKLLDTYGYWAEQKDGSQRFDLNCTLRANVPNPQGLYLEVDVDNDLLINYYTKDDVVRRYVAQWSFLLLKQRLLEKHKETFWVKATSKIENGQEYFRYDKIVHTKNPNASLFPQLIDEGIITVDYIMHRKENGTVRDHGFPFKIFPKDLDLLFPEPKTYELI